MYKLSKRILYFEELGAKAFFHYLLSFYYFNDNGRVEQGNPYKSMSREDL